MSRTLWHGTGLGYGMYPSRSGTRDSSREGAFCHGEGTRRTTHGRVNGRRISDMSRFEHLGLARGGDVQGTMQGTMHNAFHSKHD